MILKVFVAERMHFTNKNEINYIELLLIAKKKYSVNKIYKYFGKLMYISLCKVGTMLAQ